ncbi:uncharacterized protein N7503_008198 [Penicillium pulvis]|uniref:uncharacterized protein n=1 Tax=Penicillium pulvis TaxID=1562058 RepID=UPI002547D1E1|nr:uncharacterized protein N7503_008198 [Penicillium pulvis]KAJ5792220.1 hypothetical protein N7503_008198 [Penicillium pulvis]
MKLFSIAFMAMLPLALAAKSLKSVIITFPKGTPSSVITQAKDSLVASGGIITHEYFLINGFAAEAPVNALQTLSTESTEYKPVIEEDKVVSANGEFVGQEHDS